MAAERMTFTVPARIKKRAQARRDVNWSAIVTKAIEDRLASLEFADRVFSKSKLSKEDVDEFADLIDEAMQRHYGGGA